MLLKKSYMEDKGLTFEEIWSNSHSEGQDIYIAFNISDLEPDIFKSDRINTWTFFERVSSEAI